MKNDNDVVPKQATTIYLNYKKHGLLKSLSQREKTSMAAIIDDAIDKIMDSNGDRIQPI